MARLITSPDDLQALRRASRLSANLLARLGREVRPGLTTEALDKLAGQYIKRHDIKSACRGYGGFPANICTSINDDVCHGVPNNRALCSGDIVKVDVCLLVNGWYGDTCATFMVGVVSEETRHLVNATEGARRAGVAAARPGNTTRDIALAIQAHARYHDFHVVQEFGGHGIGRRLHGKPFVPSCWGPKSGDPVALAPGMAITIEPILNAGSREVYLTENEHTFRTCDGLPSAQFEHSVLITKTGCEVMTEIKS